MAGEVVELAGALTSGLKKGEAKGGAGRAHVVIDGKRVPVSAEGIASGQGGKELVDAVRAAVEHHTEG